MRYAVDKDDVKTPEERELERQGEQQAAIDFAKKNSIVRDEYFNTPSDEDWDRHKLWCIQNNVYINGKPAKEVYKELVK